MPSLVNLDALIPRQNLEASGPFFGHTPTTPSFKMLELEVDSSTRALLRKPDFQRETNAWSAKKIVELIRSFLEGDLIPAIIVWKSPTNGNIFVVDGAHRLSALMAWALDDFGDGAISREFFRNRIPDEQQVAADEVRKAVKAQIGTYN